MPIDRREDLPGTLQRSPDKARRTYAETLEHAHEEYGSEERAQLYERAKDLHIDGRSKMTKMEPAQAIARKQD
ncbi:MAG TPA: ChaB family protein [Acidimicrobiales bacterium]|nr:ChaB family protein [Acidimicrobiales bacterium]